MPAPAPLSEAEPEAPAEGLIDRPGNRGRRGSKNGQSGERSKEVDKTANQSAAETVNQKRKKAGEKREISAHCVNKSQPCANLAVIQRMSKSPKCLCLDLAHTLRADTAL